jgi:hypothetical protein
MAWTNPKTWADGEIPDEDVLNTHIRDNMNALSTHSHSGAAGDGSATLSGVDSITTDDAGSTPSAPGSNKVIIFSEGGVLKMRAGASGSALTFSTTDHSHTISQGSGASFTSEASVSTATTYSGGSCQSQATYTPTVTAGQKHAIEVFGSVVFTAVSGADSSETFYMNFEKDGTQTSEISVNYNPSSDTIVQLQGAQIYIESAASSTVFENDYRADTTGSVQYRVLIVQELRCQ